MSQKVGKVCLGDIVQMRKPHPCGSDRWEVLRTGMDFRVKCVGCGRVVMLPHRKFMKQVKAITTSGADNRGENKVLGPDRAPGTQ